MGRPMPREIVFVDLETTARDPQIGEIIEFAAVFEDGREVEFKIKPQHIKTAEAKALEINGYNEEEWDEDAICQEAAAVEIAECLKNRVIAGHGIRFDIGFIEAMSKTYKVEMRARYGLDTVSLAFEHLIPHGLRSLSMKDISRFLGFEPEPKVHRALNGARMAKMIWTKIVRANALQRWWWGVKYRFTEGRNDQ